MLWEASVGSESVWLEDQGVSVVTDFEKKQQLEERKRAGGAGRSLRVTSIRAEEISLRIAEYGQKMNNKKIKPRIFARMKKTNAYNSKKAEKVRL